MLELFLPNLLELRSAPGCPSYFYSSAQWKRSLFPVASPYQGSYSPPMAAVGWATTDCITANVAVLGLLDLVPQIISNFFL